MVYGLMLSKILKLLSRNVRQMYISLLIDTYIEFKMSACEPFQQFANPKASLLEAKSICSMDPTCTKFFANLDGLKMEAYYKCLDVASYDLYSSIGHILFQKGRNENCDRFEIYVLDLEISKQNQ